MSEPSDHPLGTFGFRCAGCGAWHTDVPAYHLAGPTNLFAIPETEREKRCSWDSDACVIDDTEFYVRGLIELPVDGSEVPFTWGVWVSLSRNSFECWSGAFDLSRRAHIGPFFGWLDTALPLYPKTRGLKTMVHLRDDFLRPLIELEPTDHPLAVEQRDGMTLDRVAEIVAFVEGDEAGEA